MTRAVHRSAVKDESCSINGHLNHEHGDNAAMGGHLRNHLHLTNFIHLKNHTHQQNHYAPERSLIKDLIALQRSRSLRDPSTSLPSWVSPSIAGSFARRPVHDCAVHDGRRSTGVDRRNEVWRLSGSLPAVGSTTLSKVVAGKAGSDYVMELGGKVTEVSKEEVGTKHNETVASGSRKSFKDSPENTQVKEKNRHGKSSNSQNAHLRTPSQQLEEVSNQIIHDPVKCPPSCPPETHVDEIHHGPNGSIYSNRNERNLVTKHRIKGLRIPQRFAVSRSNHIRNLTVGSHFVAKGTYGNGQDSELDIAGSSKNVCGIPWNWSRIHHRGKTFLDKAGRGLSCGLSDSRQRKSEAPFPEREGNTSSEVDGYDNLTPMSSDSEVLPLLHEASGSHESGVNHLLSQDYSGELGIFSNHSLRGEIDSAHASQARLGNHCKTRDCKHDRHKSLTQKYMPKTFKEIVGQTLVIQALSNVVLKNKVGLIYVFYGPHGTGKTSCAHVFAKALNCQSPEHPRPCNVCNSCTLHNLGRSKDVLELGPLVNFDFERIMDIFENMMLSPCSSQYKVFIIDDCDTLPTNSWGAISKVIDGVPSHAVFILVSSSLNHFPHTIISKCQKFFFPKLKDSDITSILQWISTNEGLEIDQDALKLVASRCNGSLRDAEMTLDQLSLLGQRVSLSLVQELVGLVPDEKLVDLLDLALSADIVNTIKVLREIMETGMEPLALMSQLATIITEILAGGYVFTRERLRRKFFHQLTLSKEDMEKLRQALKRLSEAEKHLRVSNDRSTWLTAVLLQLAPDQQYVLPNSSTDRSFSRTPIILNRNNVRGATRSPADEHDGNRGLSRGMRIVDLNSNFRDIPKGVILSPGYLNAKGSSDHISHNLVPSETNKATERYCCDRNHKETNIKEIWQSVLCNIKSDAVRQFLYSECKLHSVNLGAAPTVHLVFSSNVNKSRAEKFRVQILQAFEAILGSSVILEIRCESRSDAISDVQNAALITNENSSHATKRRQWTNNQTSVCSGPQYLRRSSLKHDAGAGTDFNSARWSRPRSHVPRECQYIDPSKMNIVPKERGLESTWIEEASSSQQHNLISLSERKYIEEQHQNKSMVRGKLPLGHVIQQAGGSSEQAGWSRRKAISIAEKLEQDNLNLEPRYRRIICWKPKRTRTKLSKLRIRPRKPCALMKLVTCGRCLSLKSPRPRV